MMEPILNIKNFVILVALGAAVFTDLRTRKVPNKLILIFAIVSVLALFITDGRSGISSALASIGTMLIFALPLYLMRAIGGGDFKILFIFSILATWNGVITTVLASLVWGSALGLAQSIFAGQGKLLAQNIFAIVTRAQPSEQVLHKIPFTLAIFFGWLSHLSLISAGVKWL